MTLCHRLISALNKLPPQEQTRAVHLCAQIVGRKGSSWKLKHLDGLDSLLQVRVEEGQPVVIEVAGFGGAAGSYALEVD